MRTRRWFPQSLVAVGAAAALALGSAAPAGAHGDGWWDPGPPDAPADLGPATDGPGAMSHYDLARKDCVGTAHTDRSRVWFTVAGGVLSDVYEPTIDTTNVETLQFVVTDGATFTDLQSRDTTYTV